MYNEFELIVFVKNEEDLRDERIVKNVAKIRDGLTVKNDG
jgi:hypothetical protein